VNRRRSFSRKGLERRTGRKIARWNIAGTSFREFKYHPPHPNADLVDLRDSQNIAAGVGRSITGGARETIIMEVEGKQLVEALNTVKVQLLNMKRCLVSLILPDVRTKDPRRSLKSRL
jgi:hypothetical protein